MDVSTPVASMGWTKKTHTASLLLVLDVQRREVGRRVVQLRDAKGWGQEELAHHAKLSVKTISRVENGRHESRNNTIERIAKALGVSKDDIWPKTAPLGLGTEDPYKAKLDRIESEVGQVIENQKEILASLAELAHAVGESAVQAPSAQRPSGRRRAGRG